MATLDVDRWRATSAPSRNDAQIYTRRVAASAQPYVGRPMADLITEAGAGDERAWRELCGRVQNVAWKVIHGFHLDAADADDAFAATMFRLLENLSRIRDPERLPGWIATTARNEVMGLFRSRQRLVLVDEFPDLAVESGEQDHDVLLDELREAVRAGFSRLSVRCQDLLRALTADPPKTYVEIEEAFGMAHGSIGPTRRRCLDDLRGKPELQRFLEGDRA